MDFDVRAQAITVDGLGAFDSNRDGFESAVQVRIFNRDTSALVGSSVTFLVGSSYTLAGSPAFLAVTPFDLAAGGHYSIVALGYSSTEMNGNTGISMVGLLVRPRKNA